MANVHHKKVVEEPFGLDWAVLSGKENTSGWTSKVELHPSGRLQLLLGGQAGHSINGLFPYQFHTQIKTSHTGVGRLDY